MKRHRGLLLGLALTALFGLSANQARAEAIVMTIQVGAGPVVDLSLFGGVGTAQGYTMDAAAIANLNLFLSTSGSEYQFSSSGATTLGGISNFPGSSQGVLGLTGTILSVTSGESLLTITQSEADFTSPTGASGLLSSTSTGNFINDPVGTGHVASSAFNATSTGPYAVLATGGVAGTANNASVGLSPVPTLYTLTNTITFNLAAGTTANPVVDGFNVLAVVTAAVPEPASLVMMLTGIPLPIVMFGLLRRRRAAA